MNAPEFQLQHPAGVHISRHLTESQLVSALPEVVESKQDMSTGWAWYRMPAFPDAEVIVGMSLGFNHGALEQISLTDTNTKYGSGWNEWSEEKERRRAESIGSWLSKRDFPASTYSWGSVWFGYDAKGGMGSAIVRFAT